MAYKLQKRLIGTEYDTKMKPIKFSFTVGYKRKGIVIPKSEINEFLEESGMGDAKIKTDFTVEETKELFEGLGFTTKETKSIIKSLKRR
jgi:hypothetical protein